jgi:hypothetical protein
MQAATVYLREAVGAEAGPNKPDRLQQSTGHGDVGGEGLSPGQTQTPIPAQAVGWQCKSCLC